MKKINTRETYFHQSKIFLKVFRVMKITIFFLLFAMSGAFAKSSYSQNTKMSLHLENASIQRIFDEIQKNTEFIIFYKDDQVDLNHRSNVNIDDATVDQILDQAFKETNLGYKIIDRQIVILENEAKESPSVLKTEANAEQKKEITGTVKDAKGMPLPGATVFIKGSIIGSITDSEGRFKINIPSDAKIITISFVGMKTQELAIGGKSTFNVTLEEETIGLGEVVAIGYGTQKKTNLTGAVGQVSGKMLENRGIRNAGQGLQGTVANLNIVTNPGDPGKIGQGSSYQIRGEGSINGGAPLILIDGVQGDLNQINPNDIENISILKDAASAAIYGARATFGVILVTTKQGFTGKMLVSINSSLSSNSITNFPKVVNSLKYAEVMNEASRNAGIADYFGAEQIARIKQYIDKPGSIPTTVPDPTEPSKWSYSLGNDNINYMKIYYKDQMLSQKHDVAISGGSGTTDYRFSAGYLDQDGVYAFGNDVYKRYNILGNINTQLNKWLKFRIQTMYNSGVTDEPYPYAGSTGNYFHVAYTRQPQWPFYDPNGHPYWTSLKEFFEGARQNTKDEEIKLVGEVIIEPVKGWKINSRYSYDKQLQGVSAHEAKLYGWDVNNAPYEVYSTNSMTRSFSAKDYKSLEVFSSYDKQIGNHSITALLGGQMENYNASGLSGYVPNLVTDEIPSLNTGTGKKDTWDVIDEWGNLGYFGRLNYNYKERYLFEANARYDGTSKFPQGKRWGFFPSVSGGWNIAKENFFKVEQINTLKLRASYGVLGNQQVGNYLFFSKVPINSNLGWLINGDRPYYIGAPGLVSNNLTWATAKTLDYGLDVNALKNRLSISFDWYSRNTIDMIGPANVLPAVLGVAVPQTNNADMVTTGFEATIGWRSMIGHDFQYNVQFNLADYVSEISKYNNPKQLLSTYYKGMKLGEIWGFETAGIIQNDEQLTKMADQRTYLLNSPWKIGDIEYRDLNKDGKISRGSNTLADPGDQRIIGNNTPRYSFGLITGCSWKGFDFNMFLQGIMKRDYWLGDIPFFGITGSWTQQIYNTTTNYWTPTNTDAYFARPYATSEITKNQLVQTRFLQNAAYVRLKNIQIGYTISKKILSSLKLQKIRVYLSGENLFYLSHIDENFDPERLGGSWGNGKTYPLLRTFTAGINIEF